MTWTKDSILCAKRPDLFPMLGPKAVSEMKSATVPASFRNDSLCMMGRCVNSESKVTAHIQDEEMASQVQEQVLV